MTITSEIELKKLISQLKLSPTNLDLLNQVAIGFMENPSMIEDSEDLKYFEKAYKTKRTVKSTNNLAWQLFFEWGEEDRAFNIQKECLDFKPKSYIPYFLFSYMLLHRKEYKLAIEYSKIAKDKFDNRIINHNIGVANYRLGDYARSIDSFIASANNEDIEFKGLFNLAVCYLKINEKEKLHSILKQLENKIAWNFGDNIDGYDIASIYYEIGDYKNATKCAIKQGLDGIDLADWTDIAYSIWSEDKQIYSTQIEKSINEKRTYISEIKNGHAD
jgi:tetratricopeptide (TPR) repeat protein